MHWGALPTKQARRTTFHPLDDRTRELQLVRCYQEQSKQPESVGGLCRNCRHSFAVDRPNNDTVQTPKMPTEAVDLTQLSYARHSLESKNQTRVAKPVQNRRWGPNQRPVVCAHDTMAKQPVIPTTRQDYQTWSREVAASVTSRQLLTASNDATCGDLCLCQPRFADWRR